jgi:hypothetical protein
MDDLKLEGAETLTAGGSTNKTGAIAGWSALWQHDMVHWDMPGIS